MDREGTGLVGVPGTGTGTQSSESWSSHGGLSLIFWIGGEGEREGGRVVVAEAEAQVGARRDSQDARRDASTAEISRCRRTMELKDGGMASGVDCGGFVAEGDAQ